MNSPSFISDYAKQAEALLQRDAVKEPLFSRGTYQIEVVDRKVSYFPFLQISEEGVLSDFFCSCKVSEKGRGCPHLAAAWLAIFSKTQEPFHVRFKKSLYNRLCQMAAKRHGYEPSCLKKEGKLYVCESSTKKRLFAIEAKNAARLKKIIAQREVETEETSIKFSNLSPEEIAKWREGKASPGLLYELSFWADLAKWMMWLSEKESPKVEFSQHPHELPHEIALAFKELSVGFYVPDAHWPWVIPALATVPSKLRVFDNGEGLEAVHYDPEKQCLILSGKEMALKEDPQGLAVGEWIYVEGQGFYRKQSDLLGKGRIEAKEIGAFLTQSAKSLQTWLDVPLQLDEVPPMYRLFFDEEHRLHIELYLFEVGDLSQAQSACFFPWVYLPSKGFYRLAEVMFEEVEKVVPRDQVADFINRHRHWLHQFGGFQTHFGSLEAHLTYSFTAEELLTFSAQLDYPEQYGEAIDFEEWVYLKGQGFYLKKPSRGRLPLHPGLQIPAEEIGAFLAAHREELEQVQGFFSSRSPVNKVGLTVRITEEERIEICPKREFIPEIEAAKVRFYGDFAYLEGEGFSELPPSSRLPERYRSAVMLTSAQEGPFLLYELEPLKPCIIELDHRLTRPQHLHLQIRKIVRDRKKRTTEWLVDAVYSSELGTVDLFSIWDAFQMKKNHLFSSGGLLMLKEPRFNWVRQLGKRKLDRKRGLIRLNTLEWIRLSIFEDLRPPLGNTPEAEQTRFLLEELSRQETHRLLEPQKHKSTLRPYQELGVQWLWFLYCHGLSGLLCDDMGLGKTHQAMALLAAIMQEDLDRTNKYLVVCPTSVIYHWQELLAKFLPDLRVCVYHGLMRTLENFDEQYDLLLTSYGILRTGKDDLTTRSFEIAIFDETQIAKNQASQTHQALREISTRMRLGLSGTPIENRLRELKALIDLVLPGYLPIDSVFREMFTNPIEKHQDEEKKQLLSRLIKPFILRRKKSEVLTDLPEKIEEISYCDLSPEQHALYRETALQMKNTIYRDLADPSRPVPYVHVFSALSTLKQICDHPALYLGKPKEYATHQSGKWDLFVELLEEARGSGQKVVVFSQYLDMLAIIEQYLKKKGIGFATIKGSTKDRSEQIRKFREDPGCEVFTASLLAAGVGIDLTVASIVIHYDRWWNPAKENQATDRVHRIGQSRGVQVFKLVTKNSIEEHIHSLIERKKGLIEELIGQDEGDRINYLSREELLVVFEKIWKEI